MYVIASFQSTVNRDLEKFVKEVGTKLTELRKLKGYTSHEDFALDHDLPRIQYWRLEKGKANFTIETLARLCYIHKISVEDFFLALYPNEKTKARRKRIIF